MDRKAKARREATIVAVFMVLFFVSVPTAYLVLDAPLAVVAVIGAVYIILAAVTLFYTRLRFKEIDEGLEDAVDDY